MIRLEGVHVILRTPEDADYAALLALRTDPEVNRYTSEPNTDPEAFVRGLINEMQAKQPGEAGPSGGWYQYVIEERASGSLIGDFGANIGGPGPRQAEIGYRLAPAAQGRGRATEGLRVLLAHLFDDLALHRVIALAAVANAPSWRLLERVGFRREGAFRQSFWKDGRWLDDYYYALLAEEWRGSVK